MRSPHATIACDVSGWRARRNGKSTRATFPAPRQCRRSRLARACGRPDATRCDARGSRAEPREAPAIRVLRRAATRSPAAARLVPGVTCACAITLPRSLHGAVCYVELHLTDPILSLALRCLGSRVRLRVLGSTVGSGPSGRGACSRQLSNRWCISCIPCCRWGNRAHLRA